MSSTLVPVFYVLVSVATGWLALLCCAGLKPSRRARIGKALIGAATVLLLFVPIGGLPLWNRAFSVYSNPSLPLLGLVCAALWQRLLGIVVFKPADWRAMWIFGATAGSLLYLLPHIVGELDLYYWGWNRAFAPWVLAALAIGLLGWGSRLGILLLAGLIAYAVSALESQNCWDYIIDPIYWLISLFVLGARAGVRAFQPLWMRWQGKVAQRVMAAAVLPAVALVPMNEEAIKVGVAATSQD